MPKYIVTVDTRVAVRVWLRVEAENETEARAKAVERAKTEELPWTPKASDNRVYIAREVDLDA